ncbi:MAG: c-type cytochrome [Gemmatimonadales bacterium]
MSGRVAMGIVRRATALAFGVALAFVSRAQAQLPQHPENLQVLPKTLSTDSVFALMLDVADALGVTCGLCHVGGDRPTWDSTHFASDALPMKVTARAMFRLTNRLNTELLPAIPGARSYSVVVTCLTCHRGARRPVTLSDTLLRILDQQGVDSTIAADQRFREQYAGRMAYDLTEVPLNTVAARLVTAGRFVDAARVLEANAREFPGSAEVAYRLGFAYEKAGDRPRAIAQYHKVLSIRPDDARADRHLRALLGAMPESPRPARPRPSVFRADPARFPGSAVSEAAVRSPL